MPMGQAMFGKSLTLASAILLLAACLDYSDEVSVPLRIKEEVRLLRENARVPDASEWTGACADWDDWDKPAPPFRIHGNTYYVGTCGISSILVIEGDDAVLIDSGTQAGAESVLQNTRTLGLHWSQIKALLFSHEHFDHIGGMAHLHFITGATVYADTSAREVLRTGVAGNDDPQAGMHEPMAPVTSVQPIARGAELTLFDHQPNGLKLQSIWTPGHTPGAVSWQWESCDNTGDCKTIVYADSLSPVSADAYQFSDHPEYLAAYRAGIARVAALECDILLTPHPSASGMRDKLLAGDLASGMNCAEYAASITERLDARLAEEAGR
jgi:metallo-beta-lactamase class B